MAGRNKLWSPARIRKASGLRFLAAGWLALGLCLPTTAGAATPNPSLYMDFNSIYVDTGFGGGGATVGGFLELEVGEESSGVVPLLLHDLSLPAAFDGVDRYDFFLRPFGSSDAYTETLDVLMLDWNIGSDGNVSSEDFEILMIWSNPGGPLGEATYVSFLTTDPNDIPALPDPRFGCSGNFFPPSEVPTGTPLGTSPILGDSELPVNFGLAACPVTHVGLGANLGITLDLDATVVPEPGATASLLVAAGVLGAFRRRGAGARA